MSEFRIEHDPMGPVQVPAQALWGAQTQRAVDNFPISGRGLAPRHIHALGRLKATAAEVNAELNKAEPVLPGDALLMLLARSYEVQGNVAKSKEAYRRISTEFPDSSYAIEATRRAG